MSDSVTNTNTGDVLSSIKRLVNEDGREESEFIFIPTAPKPGRLVLTEALRVSEAAPLKLTPANSARPDPVGSVASSEPMRLESGDAVVGENSAPQRPNGRAPTEGRHDLTGSLSAKIEALEAAIARTEDQWEPDGETNEAYSGTKTRSVNWAVRDGIDDHEEVETEIDDRPLTFIRHSDTPKSRKDDSPSEDLMARFPDEDALRAFIAEVVRDELQGVLGARITKSLRKMVRREIYRAVVTQKLE